MKIQQLIINILHPQFKTAQLLSDGNVSKSMSRFEQGLDTRWFFRTHKSYIINMNHFSAYRSENGNNVVMNNGAVIPVSRHRLKAFREIIKNYHGTINL